MSRLHVLISSVLFSAVLLNSLQAEPLQLLAEALLDVWSIGVCVGGEGSIYTLDVQKWKWE